jgi:uncharacterized protein
MRLRTLGRSFRAALLALGAVVALSLAFPPAAIALDVPPLRGRVNDLAGLLPADRKAALEDRLARYEADTSHQIVLLTVPSLEGDPIEDFSIRVAEAWKLGHTGLDDGILVIVVPNDRNARIEVGRGLEGVVPDVIASRILRDRMFPLFREGRAADGIESGLDAVMAAAKGEVIPEERRPQGPAAHGFGIDPLAAVFLGAIVGSFFATPFRRTGLRPVGGLVSAGAAGVLVHLLVGIALWTGVGALLGAVMGLFGGPGLGPGAMRRRGGYGRGFPGSFGGGGFGGGGGGGGFSGGGGGFAGGGASGSW